MRRSQHIYRSVARPNRLRCIGIYVVIESIADCQETISWIVVVVMESMIHSSETNVRRKHQRYGEAPSARVHLLILPLKLTVWMNLSQSVFVDIIDSYRRREKKKKKQFIRLIAWRHSTWGYICSLQFELRCCCCYMCTAFIYPYSS